MRSAVRGAQSAAIAGSSANWGGSTSIFLISGMTFSAKHFMFRSASAQGWSGDGMKQYTSLLLKAIDATEPQKLTIEAEMGDREFVAANHPTIADCTLFAASEFARFGGLDLFERFPGLARWRDAFAKRPSAQGPA